MSKRRLRPAAQIVSDIGALAFELQHHGDTDIVEAVKFCREVNPDMYTWLASVLGSFRSAPSKSVDARRKTYDASNTKP